MPDVHGFTARGGDLPAPPSCITDPPLAHSKLFARVLLRQRQTRHQEERNPMKTRIVNIAMSISHLHEVPTVATRDRIDLRPRGRRVGQSGVRHGAGP